MRGLTGDPSISDPYATDSLDYGIPMIHHTGKKMLGDDEAARSIRLQVEEGKKDNTVEYET
jgi:hypothetical protein